MDFFFRFSFDFALFPIHPFSLIRFHSHSHSYSLPVDLCVCYSSFWHTKGHIPQHLMCADASCAVFYFGQSASMWCSTSSSTEVVRVCVWVCVHVLNIEWVHKPCSHTTLIILDPSHFLLSKLWFLFYSVQFIHHHMRILHKYNDIIWILQKQQNQIKSTHTREKRMTNMNCTDSYSRRATTKIEKKIHFIMKINSFFVSFLMKKSKLTRGLEVHWNWKDLWVSAKLSVRFSL